MQPSGFTRLFLLVAAFAACVQWTIPHGWMIGSADGGSVVLVPCPSTSPELASLGHSAMPGPGDDHHAPMQMASMHGDMDHDTDGADGHGAAQAQCDFAAMGAPFLPPETPALAPPPVASADLLLAVFPETIPGRGLAAPPPPSTGPPFSRA